MSYTTDTLIDNESVIHASQVSFWAFAKPILLGVLALIAGVWAIRHDSPTLATYFLAVVPNVALYVWIVQRSTEMAVTNMRVLIKTGVVKRDTWELYLTRIEGVEVDQSVWGRLFNYGDLRVRGVGTEVAPIRMVRAPLAFRKAVFSAGTVTDAYRQP